MVLLCTRVHSVITNGQRAHIMLTVKCLNHEAETRLTAGIVRLDLQQLN